MVALIKRGEVWVCNLNPPRGKEVGKIRPCLVIQDDALDDSVTPMVIVLPMTTQIYPMFKHWRITIPERDRLLRPCQVITNQPRAMDRSRLGEGPLTILTEEEMAAVERSFLAVVGMSGFCVSGKNLSSKSE